LQRLTEVDCSSGKTLFSYDPLGRRVQKVDENSSGAVLATYQYHYDGSNVAVEYQPSTTWTYYLYGGNVVLRDSGTIKQWYYREGHGSVSAVADSSGNVLEAYEYNMQGQVQITNGSSTVLSSSGIGNDLLYCEYRYDSETQNYFCEARYYSTTLGRFISRDPLSGAEFSQGTNLYAYCKNNYLNATDATGMCQNESSWGAFWEGVSDGHAWEQSSAATADGLLTFGGLMGKGPFAIDAGNQYNQNISQDLGGVASAAFTAAGGVGMLGRGATQLTAAQRVQQLAQGGLTQIQRDRFVTLGVTETQEGVRIITSSSSTLEAGVRSMLTENEIGIVTDLCITD
jgi:RHS repeat-associated protein